MAHVPTKHCDEMYKCGSVYGNEVFVDLPSSMYKAPIIYSNLDTTLAMQPELKELEIRQLNTLNDLEQLSVEIKQIAKMLNHNFDETLEKASQCKEVKETKKQIVAPVLLPNLPPGKLDFVISVSSQQPSITPLLIAELLKHAGVKVAITYHIHSSCHKNVSDEVLDIVKSGNLSRTDADVVLTFIWKKDNFLPSLMFSPLHQTRIYGDAAIARYLCRTLAPTLFDESDVTQAVSIEKWLDSANQIFNGSSKEKDASMKSLNAHLGQNQLICSNIVSVADLVLLSSILANKLHFQTLPKNVKRWFSYLSSSLDSIINQFNVPAAWLS